MLRKSSSISALFFSDVTDINFPRAEMDDETIRLYLASLSSSDTNLFDKENTKE